jgi:N-acetylglucosaminyldiphosphoundecaprenol N-acetyl-beta-D-mannosaminyltransferase
LVPAISRVHAPGAGISAINMEMAPNAIETWIARAESHYVCVTPVHSAMEYQRDSALAELLHCILYSFREPFYEYRR